MHWVLHGANKIKLVCGLLQLSIVMEDQKNIDQTSKDRRCPVERTTLGGRHSNCVAPLVWKGVEVRTDPLEDLALKLKTEKSEGSNWSS